MQKGGPANQEDLTKIAEVTGLDLNDIRDSLIALNFPYRADWRKHHLLYA